MSTLEELKSPEVIDDDGMEALKKQAEEKKKALEQPTRKDVTNQACKFWNKFGVYEGSWLSGGKNKLNCPGAGKGTFTSGDLEIKGEWDANGKLTKIESGKLKANGRDYDVKGANFDSADPTKLVSIKCEASVNGYKYECELDADLKLKKLTYLGVSLSFFDDNTLMNSNYNSSKSTKSLLKIGSSSVPVDLAAIRIAKCISIVKNAISSGDKDGLEYFEADGDYALEADYTGTGWDTTLLRNCPNSTGRDNETVAAWLNRSRTDFGL